MSNLVKIHNNLTDLPLDGFTSGEIDIFNALCYICQNRNNDEIVIPLKEIQKLAEYHTNNQRQFINRVVGTNKKLLALSMMEVTETKISQFTLFSEFTIDCDKKTLTACVSPKFSYLLNHLMNKYTTLEIKESASLDSKYSKLIYRRLREYRDVGFWNTSIEDFRKYCGLTPKTPVSNLDRIVIKPAIKELAPFFSRLKVNKIYSSSNKVGRPSVIGFSFTFKPEKHKEHTSCTPNAIGSSPRLSQRHIASITGWTVTPFVCPKCHRQIYSKQMTNDYGTYILYGHTDWQTGECNYITNDSENLIDEHEVERDQKMQEMTAHFEERDRKKKNSGRKEAPFNPEREAKRKQQAEAEVKVSAENEAKRSEESVKSASSASDYEMEKNKELIAEMIAQMMEKMAFNSKK